MGPNPFSPFDVFFYVVAACLGLAVGLVILGAVGTVFFIAWRVAVARLARSDGG